jgi:hypothetical protein
MLLHNASFSSSAILQYIFSLKLPASIELSFENIWQKLLPGTWQPFIYEKPAKKIVNDE